jgi:hypothetical protein
MDDPDCSLKSGIKQQSRKQEKVDYRYYGYLVQIIPRTAGAVKIATMSR